MLYVSHARNGRSFVLNISNKIGQTRNLIAHQLCSVDYRNHAVHLRGIRQGIIQLVCYAADD